VDYAEEHITILLPSKQTTMIVILLLSRYTRTYIAWLFNPFFSIFSYFYFVHCKSCVWTTFHH